MLFFGETSFVNIECPDAHTYIISIIFVNLYMCLLCIFLMGASTPMIQNTTPWQRSLFSEFLLDNHVQPQLEHSRIKIGGDGSKEDS
jgi:hypothetical protein